MFEVGDKVKCVTTDGVLDIELRKVYTIKCIYDDNLVGLVEVPFKKFFSFRFQRVGLALSPFAQWEKDVGVNENCFT